MDLSDGRFLVQKTIVWEEGPSGQLVIVQKLLVHKESHVVSRAGLGGERKALLGVLFLVGSSDSQLRVPLFYPTLRGS